MKQEHDGFTVTLNNGQREIADSSISVSWQLSDVLARAARYILIIVVPPGGHSVPQCVGIRRYLVKTTDVQTFLTFYQAGTHTVLFFPLDEVEIRPYTPVDLIKTDGRTTATTYSYNYTVSWDPAGRVAHRGGRDISLRGVRFEIEIPDGVFGQKPQRGIAKAVYNVVNTGWKYEPADKCEYRKRALLSFLTPHFYVIVTGRILKMIGMILLSFVASILLVCARLIAAFFGYRPMPLFSGIGTIWKRQVRDGRVIPGPLSKAGIYVSYFEHPENSWIYADPVRVWNADQDHVVQKDDRPIVKENVEHEGQVVRAKRILMSPAEFVFGIIAPVMYAWHFPLLSFWGVFLLCVGAAICTSIGLRLWYRKEPRTTKLVKKVWRGSLLAVCIVVVVMITAHTMTQLSGSVVDMLVYSIAPGVVLGIVGYLVYRYRHKIAGLRKIPKEMKEKWQQKRKKHQAKRDRELQRWVSAAKGATPSVDMEAQEEVLRERQTFGDKVRLKAQHIKHKVCKPYPSS